MHNKARHIHNIIERKEENKHSERSCTANHILLNDGCDFRNHICRLSLLHTVLFVRHRPTWCNPRDVDCHCYKPCCLSGTQPVDAMHIVVISESHPIPQTCFMSMIKWWFGQWIPMPHFIEAELTQKTFRYVILWILCIPETPWHCEHLRLCDCVFRTSKVSMWKHA